MKQITNYIIEALKINAKTKIVNNFLAIILEFIYNEPSDADTEEVKVIKKWIEDNDVKYLNILLSKNNLKSLYADKDLDIKEIEDIYKDLKDVKLTLQDGIFINLGDNYYTDKYKQTYIFINDKKWLTYAVSHSYQIYFVPYEVKNIPTLK